MTLIGIVGSLRKGSVNAAASRAACELNEALSVHDVSAIPLFDGDVEDAGRPASVTALYDAVAAADGIVLFSPEYNSSLPAVTKNVIDWLSRDPDRWEGTGITMVTMSPGGRAGQGAREHFEAIMPRQSTRLFPTIGFGNHTDRLDANGEVSDATTRAELAAFLSEFADFCAS